MIFIMQIKRKGCSPSAEPLHRMWLPKYGGVINPGKNDISLINSKFLSSTYGGPKGDLQRLYGKKKSDKYFFTRYIKITNHLMGLRVGVHVGNKFQSFRVYASLLGLPLSGFIQTKKHNLSKELLKKKNIASKNTTKKKK